MAGTKQSSPELKVASSDGEPVKPEKDRKFVEALSRGLDVLRAFSQGPVILGNQDIARITGLPKPTISRMTYTLTKLGYLSYNTQLEKYQLSSGVLALGYAYVSNLKVRQLAKRTEEATSEISGLVEGISGSVNTTVDALESSVNNAKSNIEQLTSLADETTLSSQRVQEMRTSMMEVDNLMESQGQAVHRITSTVSALVDVSSDASRETIELSELSKNLDSAATDLKKVVDRFSL